MAFWGIFGSKKNEGQTPEAVETIEKEAAERLDAGLQKTKRSIFDKLAHAVAGKDMVDDDVLDSIEEALITSDVGVETTQNIIERLEERVARDKYLNANELNDILCEEIEALLDANGCAEAEPFDFSKKPYVIMVVGVNGVGKTTTIGKLAAQLKDSGKKVVLGAADTFRAAAVEQLSIWSDR
ncbi:MAG: signal recognition particle receptor subunit alpha, partial [Bacteroidales bacterium]|nr:signal recognition particle receptor subunit alpha [Bacteroidales bacterium]